MSLAKLLIEMTPPKVDSDHAYKMGYDCGINGANKTNCHFSIFSSPENTKAWEKGKSDAETNNNLDPPRLRGVGGG